MNVIYRWAVSKLLEDWTETTWWAEAVLPEFARDRYEDGNRTFDREATQPHPPDEQQA